MRTSAHTLVALITLLSLATQAHSATTTDTVKSMKALKTFNDRLKKVNAFRAELNAKADDANPETKDGASTVMLAHLVERLIPNDLAEKDCLKQVEKAERDVAPAKLEAPTARDTPKEANQTLELLKALCKP